MSVRRPSPVDGHMMTAEQDAAIDRAFAAALGDAELVVDYLRQTTLLRVLSCTASDDELRHMEGMRDLARIILMRIDRGRHAAQGKPSPDPLPGEDERAVPVRIGARRR